jgi:hypothetical protein
MPNRKRDLMVNDTEAREAVRQLMNRFEGTAVQGIGMAYVLANKDLNEYARLLEAVERAIPTVIQPLVDADLQRRQVHAALDDPNADWAEAVLAMLHQGPLYLTSVQAMDIIRPLDETG